MRGKEGIPHTDPDDPPRRRADQAKGHGTWETDRPPVPGVIGRESGRLRLRVGQRGGSAELVDATVLPATRPAAMGYTDDWNGYNPLVRRGRGHATVNQNRGEFARDDDGDGIRAVHRDPMEGIWTGLRDSLRPFRGVNEVYLEQYVIIFEWSSNLKAVSDEFLRILLGIQATTKLVT
jgi:transposase